MGSAIDDVWLETDAPDGFVPQKEAPRPMWFRAGFAVLLLAVGLPVAGVTAIVMSIAASSLAGIADAGVNGVPFQPGRWEAEDGAYWVQLDADGTGVVRLPGDATSSFACDQAMFDGDVSYELPASSRGTPGYLDVVFDTPDDPACVNLRLYLFAGGWGLRGYDWRLVNYSIGDPDVVDLTLHRVD